METLIIAVVAVVFILITREIWTWYLKQNTLVSQNKEIIQLLKKLVKEE